MYKGPPSGLLERVNGPFFCRENVKWIFFTRENVKQDTCVNVKLEILVREFVNLDLCVNVKHDDITRIYNLQVSFHLSNQRRSHGGPGPPKKIMVFFPQPWWGFLRL